MACDEGFKGKLQEINVPGNTKFDIIRGFDMPKILYPFKNNLEYGKQLVCRFEVLGRIYFIPCMEVVRSILAPYKAFAYQLLRPHGLDYFIESHQIRDNTLEINLTEKCPREIVNDTAVAYLAWLRFDKAANFAWNMIYSNLIKKATEMSPSYPAKEFSKGIPVEVVPPMNGNSVWTFRGVSCYNTTLILELIHRSKLNRPSFRIAYSHYSLEKLEADNKPKRAVQTRGVTGEDGEVVLDNDLLQSAKKQQSQKITGQQPILFSFKENPRMIKIRRNKRNIHTGVPEKDQKETINRNGDKQRSFSMQDWESEGKIPPMEFKSLELVKVNPYKGLEDFKSAIDLLQKRNPMLDIYMSAVYVPLGKRFSRYKDGYRRTCAIVKIVHSSYIPCYILEIGRADSWSISTLFIWPVSSTTAGDVGMEQLCMKILRRLVDNKGHWDMEFFQGFVEYKCDKLNHVSGQTPERWAERIRGKLVL